MLSLTLLLNHFSHQKKRILFISLGFVIPLLLYLFSFLTRPAEQNKVAAHVTIPPPAKYIPGELIVRFRDEYVPLDLYQQTKKRQEENASFLGRIKNGYEDIKSGVSQQKTAEGKLKIINKDFQMLGITSFDQLVNDSDKVMKSYYVVRFDSEIPIADMQKKLASLDYLYSTEADAIFMPFAIPNDPHFSATWGMQKIEAPKAWDIKTDAASVIVAVLDSGVDLNHPDLKENLISGYNSLTGSGDPSDDVGHGTHVAGTIGAVGNNTVGVVGVNWKVKLMPVKALGPSGGTSVSILRGISYAVDNGAKVINMSIGNYLRETGPMPCARTSYESAISSAVSRGVVVVVAAGNDAAGAAGVSPASCPEAITVGSTLPSDARSSFSNFGSEVDMAAPGSAILSTFPEGAELGPNCKDSNYGSPSDGYGRCDGTSMATPHVAGAAALLLAVNPSLNPQQVRDCLVNNGDPITTDRPIGGVRLNLFKSLQACSSGAPLSPSPSTSITLSPTTPAATLPPGTTATPTPTPTPTTPPVEEPGVVNTPTPTPREYFTCQPDPACVQGGRAIQLCPLVCTPQ